jgi:hypothetical protein
MPDPVQPDPIEANGAAATEANKEAQDLLNQP